MLFFFLSLFGWEIVALCSSFVFPLLLIVSFRFCAFGVRSQECLPAADAGASSLGDGAEVSIPAGGGGDDPSHRVIPTPSWDFMILSSFVIPQCFLCPVLLLCRLVGSPDLSTADLSVLDNFFMSQFVGSTLPAVMDSHQDFFKTGDGSLPDGISRWLVSNVYFAEESSGGIIGAGVRNPGSPDDMEWFIGAADPSNAFCYTQYALDKDPGRTEPFQRDIGVPPLFQDPGCLYDPRERPWYQGEQDNKRGRRRQTKGEKETFLSLISSFQSHRKNPIKSFDSIE